MATITNVDVVVLKGKTVWHDGTKINENTKFSLPSDAATRLIKYGFVKLYSDVVAQVTAAASAPAVTISTTAPAAASTTAAAS
jgi:hypothetical protein